MKTIYFAGLLVGASFVVGCNSDTRVDTGHTPPTNTAAMSEDARVSTKQGTENASISQQVMKTHRYPNGQPLPGYGGAAAPPPPGPPKAGGG